MLWQHRVVGARRGLMCMAKPVWFYFLQRVLYVLLLFVVAALCWDADVLQLSQPNKS